MKIEQSGFAPLFLFILQSRKALCKDLVMGNLTICSVSYLEISALFGFGVEATMFAFPLMIDFT